MVTNLNTFIVTWYDESDAYATTKIITQDVVAGSMFTDTGSGEVNEAEIVVSAARSRHINTDVVFDKFDRIEVDGFDRQSNRYHRFFEIDDILPTQSKGEGALLTLKCLGIEKHLQDVHVSRAYWFGAPRQVASDIINIYHENKGVRQPTVTAAGDTYTNTTEIGNGLPAFTRAHYEFGLTEDYAYNRMQDILDTMLQAVGASGVLKPFEQGYEATQVNTVDIRLFESGVGPLTSTITIENTVTVTVSEQEGVISNPSGTRVLAWGDGESGSLPLGHSKYRSKIFQFLYRPAWSASVDYATGSTVFLATSNATVVGGTHWEATDTESAGTTPDANAGEWKRVTMANAFGNTDSVSPIQYSPWTDDKARLWVNSGCSPTDAVSTDTVVGGDFGFSNGTVSTTSVGAQGDCAFFDQNIIISTPDFFRTWANIRMSPTLGISGVYTYSGDSNVPVGIRALVMDRGIFVAGTLDRYGNEISNCVAEYQEVRENPNLDGSYEWTVKYSFADDSNKNRSQVGVFNETQMYEWKSTSNAFEANTNELANDCFHKWTTLSNVSALSLTDFRPYQTSPSLFPELTTGAAWSGNVNSAIQVEYDFGAITDRVTSPSAYLYRGAWICLQAPFPATRHGGISEELGELYGGGSRNSATWSINQPSRFDFSNMSFTFDGLQGFNQDESSETLGAVSSIHFQCGVVMENTGFLQYIFGNTLGGSVGLRCCAVDTADNIVAQDFEITHTDGLGIPIDLPVSGFANIKSHRPRWLDFASLDLASFITPKEQDIQNVFEWRNVKFIMIYMLNVYDEFGRYNPEGNLDKLDQTALQIAGGNIKLLIDDFHFVKPLLANSRQATTSNIEPDFVQHPEIILYDQLKNVAKAEEEKEQHPHKQYDLTTVGNSTFNMKFGDTFYFTNGKIVNDNDNNTSFTVELVAKRLEFSLTKPGSGPGGLRRSIMGIKRFV